VPVTAHPIRRCGCVGNQRTLAGSQIFEGSPKTKAGARTVALDADTVAAIKAWRAQQSSERLVIGAGWPDSGLVFTNPDGGGLWPQRVTARFRTIADELDLPPIGVHGLRHSAATWMIGAGVSPKLVQQRLGHADVSITLGLYSHVMPGHDRDAAEALAKAVASSGRSSVIKP
jgi:integrase